MAILEPTKGGYYLWNFVPSIAAATIFILAFLVLTALISWRMFKTKTWFCVPFAIGGFLEFAGYCARASAHSKTGRIMPFAVQNMFILLGPVLFAASIYMCLGRIIRGVGADHLSVIRPQILTKLFVTGDILSLLIQGGASGLMVTGKNVKLGEGIVLAGLVAQIILFGLFGVTFVMFRRRILRSPTPESRSSGVPWMKSLRMLSIVTVLIMVRSLFRVVEYAMGNDGYPLKNEWTLYIFDSLLMAIVMLVYFLWYPTWITFGKEGPSRIPLSYSTSA